ncbi:MAG: ABC transporter permease [Thermoplasmata archaeon]|nr:ABC transporter permease [Thermoplasmata archaeon]
MRMWIYIVRRMLLLLPVIIGVMTITFVLVSTLPVDTKLNAYYGPSKFGYSPTVACSQLGLPGTGMCPNPAYVRGVHALGLNQPIYLQWLTYMKNSLTLNWGSTEHGSYASTNLIGGSTIPVTTVLSYFLPYTLELAALSLLLILALAIPLGNYSAVYRNRPLDQATRVLSFSGFALPGFLLAILLLLGATVLAGQFSQVCGGQSTPFFEFYGSWPPSGCLPGGELPKWVGAFGQTSPTGFPTVDAIIHQNWFLAWESVKRQILPAVSIAYGSVAGILRFVRNSMLEVMNLDFIRTARSKGVPESVVVRKHAGRNSLNVTITVLGLTFAGFIGGFAIIELVFHLRGIGLLLAYSILPSPDFGLIFGTTLLFTIIVVAANIIVDILYAYLDPRVRLG